MRISRSVAALAILGLISAGLLATPTGPQAATVAGVTSGAMAVDERGQASYEIPLAVPPGIAGLEPSLSLIYNSGAGNGLLGLGWSLGGLSVIHRCARTIVQDGAAGGVNYDADDRFCLDGKRLVAISGAYGAEGTEYRTEVDGLFKVVSHGAAGSGPAWFRVWTKSGQIMDYGATEDARVEAQGRAEAKVWAVDRIADTAGNYLTLSYVEDTVAGAHLIDRIDYTANDAAAVVPQSAVEFVYEPRPDMIQGYTGGALGAMDQRLAAIQAVSSGTVVREYGLAYETSAATGQSRLVSVAECVGAGDCLQPIDFFWQDNAGGWQESTTQQLPFQIHSFDSMTPYGRQNGEFLDLNGDGLLDFAQAIRVSASSVSSAVIYLRKTWIRTDDGWMESAAYKVPFDATFESETGFRTRYSDFVDVNGDGLQDFVSSFDPLWSPPYRKTWLNTGSGWIESPEHNPPFSKYWLAANRGEYVDIDGDGLSDYVAARNNNGHWTDLGAWLNTGNGWQESPAYVPPFIIHHGTTDAQRQNGDFIDVNGDGLLDFLQALAADGINSQATWLNVGNGWSESVVHKAPFVTRSYDSATPTGRQGGDFLDVNGDGLMDFVQAIVADGVTSQATWLNTGSGWVESLVHKAPFVTRSFDSITPNGRQNGDFVDIDGNGLLDFVEAITAEGQTNQTAWLNTGNGWIEGIDHKATFVARTFDSVTPDGRQNGAFVDVDGDGLADFIQSVVAGGQTQKSTWLNESPEHGRLISVNSSLGARTTITYAPLTDPAVYEKGSGAVFPVQDIQSPLYVVSSVSQDDGLGGQAVTRYSYAGAKVHLQGRGFLGFRLMDSIDEQTGIATTTRYAQDFPFTGQVEFTESYLADGTTLSRTVNTLEALSLNGGATLLPIVSRSVVESYEPNHGPNNTSVTTVTTDSLYDDYGNPTQITVTTEGGGESFVTTTASSYTNDTTNWFLGRLTRAEVTKTLPDLSSATRVSAFAYDPATGLLSQEVVEPDLPAFTLTTDHARDVFGNITTTTVSGADIASRTSNTEYSADGRFAVKAVNALGHAETRAYDARFGTVISLTGPNLLTTTWDHDGFGRKTREARADGTETRWSYELCAAQCPAGAVYAVVRQDLNTASQTPIGPRAVQSFDALNRAFQNETEGFDGTKILVVTEFNARGEAVAVTRPYFEGTAAGDIQKVVTTYDLVGRPLSVTQADGGVTTTDYDGLVTTSTNALNQIQIRRSNAIGELVEATDNLGTVVTYGRDPFGNLLETDAGGVVTTMSYDIRGRKISMNDPSMGIWFYDHNILGELISQTDAKGQSVTLDYDILGRMVRRVEPEGTTEWVYDTATKGIGKLQSVTAPGGYARSHSYDGLGRPSGTITTIDGMNYASGVTYDGSGRVEIQSYPSGFAVRNHYNARGFLASVSDDGGATVYWRVESVDAEGQVTRETLGNGVTSTRSHDPRTGLVDSIITTLGAATIQDLAYDFDKLGNLKTRADLRQGRAEASLYDGLNRLTATTLTDTGAGGGQLAVTTLTYNSLGNIASKSDVGTYSYGGGGAGPHAVTAAGGETYAYDANGNMTSGAGRSITWTSFNKPALIRETASGNEADFTYGPERARIRQHIVENNLARDVVYIGGLYEKRSRFGTPDELVHYIRAGGTVAIYTIHDDNLASTNKARYLHRDHLGSVDTVTGETGAVVERLSFDPHGKRRLADWQAGTPANPDAETPRGFTGHEHLDSVGLIHMNGRVYDPTLGRFLSADPFVQAPDTTQGFNRYSYAGNNPLSYTDPSGFFFKAIGKFFKKVFKAIGKVFKAIFNAVKSVLRSSIGQLIGGLVASSFGPVAAAAFSSLVTVANGGSLTDALMAGAITFATAKAFSFADKAFGSPVTRTVAHGLIGGVSSKLRGGRFGAGFLSNAFTHASGLLSGNVPGGGLGKAITATVAGGVSAVLGGGKFANGAMSAAFGRLFERLDLTEFRQTAGRAFKGVVDWLIGRDFGAAWLELFGPRGPGPTGGTLPNRWRGAVKKIGALSWRELGNPDANGMHSWHAATNAWAVEELGVVGIPLIFLAGVFHETPFDSASFSAEQLAQGTVNHIYDSITDIVANVFGMGVGLVSSRDESVRRALRWGHYIPGPGDPNPHGLGAGFKTYTGDPTQAWGQYP